MSADGIDLERARHLAARVTSPGFIYHGGDEADELAAMVPAIVDALETARRDAARAALRRMIDRLEPHENYELADGIHHAIRTLEDSIANDYPDEEAQ